jgi:sialic acid synthase SpsE
MKTNIFTKNNQTTHTYVIAEAGLNHNGSVEIAKQLIDLAVEAGADAVKFQKRTVDKLAVKATLDAPDDRFPEFGKTYREIREHLEFNMGQYKIIKFKVFTNFSICFPKFWKPVIWCVQGCFNSQFINCSFLKLDRVSPSLNS